MMTRRKTGFVRIAVIALMGLLVVPAGLRAQRALSEEAKRFLREMPKAELHVHLEGTIEPEDYIALVKRNGLTSRYASAEEVVERLKYQRDLKTFIEVYEELLAAMVTEQDFHDTAMTYFRRAKAQGVRRVEMFFDPQMHTTRGVALSTVMNGLTRAIEDAARELEVEVALIACFNRDRSAESAMELLPALAAWWPTILGVGLDNPEEIGFPAKFAAVFEEAARLGFRLTSHCDVGVPNTLAHHWDAIRVLEVERIDHGLGTSEDPELLALVKERGIGLTACPTLFHREIPGRMEYRSRAIKQLLEAGVLICVNSDDPGLQRELYVGDLYVLTTEAAGLSRAHALQLAANSFKMSWTTEENQRRYLALLEEFASANPVEF
jgi:adenosine deaminase